MLAFVRNSRGGRTQRAGFSGEIFFAIPAALPVWHIVSLV